MESEDESTRIDLGDDLLESTGLIPGLDRSASSSKDPEPLRFDFDENFHSAEILYQEKLFEEAKSVLRSILTKKPDEVRAQKLLERIHEEELKQILTEEPRAPRLRHRKAGYALRDDLDQVNIEKVVLDLEREIGALKEDPGSLLGAFEITARPDLSVEARFAGTSAQDRMDIGLGYLGMGLFETALYHFRRGIEIAQRLYPEGRAEAFQGSMLAAYALILGGRPWEAQQFLDPLVTDAEFPAESFPELAYLMGRTFESVGEWEVALGWYRKTLDLDPAYRDTVERYRNLRILKG